MHGSGKRAGPGRRNRRAADPHSLGTTTRKSSSGESKATKVG